ncbi:prolipoprotein diacylglyceryl transferase [Mesomycoplasma moatsii]|uniref:prolipoprotein diacylglyceryl transferase n=1 Tax=Mesomycoplasma moatsii TaxID=171287 RepID=UPI0003B3BE96
MTNLYSWSEGEPIYLFGSFRLYPFTMLVGIIASIFSVLYFWKKNRYPIDVLLTIIIITIPSAIIGARLFWIIETAINKESLSRWYAIWDGGLSIQGGVFVPAVLDLLYLRRKKNIIDTRKAFGLILPNVLLGQAIGRWGNFANHELYGAVCEYDSIKWLGSTISWNMYIEGEFRVPLFLIESMTSMIGYIIIVWWLLQFGKLEPGTTGGVYLLWYGIIRVILEPFRDPKDFEYWYLILAIIFIVLGLILIFYFEFTGRKIYEKHKYAKYSYFYYNTKVQIMPINISSKWINE